MKLSLSSIALIGSLRSRIVIIISLMTIAVQLVIYTIVDRTNEDFNKAHEASVMKRVVQVIPAVVNAELQLMDNELLKTTASLIERTPSRTTIDDAIALLDFRNTGSLTAANRYLLLTDTYKAVVYNGDTSVEKIPVHDIVASSVDEFVHSGFFDKNKSFLTVSTNIRLDENEYTLTISSSLDKNVLPAIGKLAQVSTRVSQLSEAESKATTERGKAQIAPFPEAKIDAMYRTSPELDSLIGMQKTRLQILLASSLIVVLFLGMALARELTKPLKLLVEATKKIKNGDYSVMVPLMHRDEIGELAETIDSMRQHVGEREDEILKLAYADSLTDLPNRALFDDRLTTTVARGQRKGEPFAVVVLDMDRFKYINDVLGHESGDYVLKEVAMRLNTTLRPYDTVARLGGDEFALLLQDVTETDILTAVGRIASMFDEPVTLNNQPIDIGCSIGIAKYPEHGEDASTLLRRADMAMYSAKRSDTTFAFYDPNCDEHREEHLSLLSEIKRAIELDELQLFFQPKVTLGDSSVLSVETLLRWQHPSRGLIPPDEFIPFAEQTGAIRLITRWLIAKAMIQARNWADQGLSIKMSVNISARDLLDSDFAGYVSKRLIENKVQPQMMCMEITESALMEDPLKAKRTVEELHKLGVSISIDDYGTGYSSLAYVKNLPVNELKIDREFIKNMINNKQDIAIVRSTIELGHNLGMKVVAEGIEREEEMQMLKDFGCDQAQGYLISKALTATDMQKWISENRTLPTDFNDPNFLKSVGQN
ncbi:EAL domain-containing protein [Granulosicoccus sp.]|nr:EAL domain-containing protein [Granulosicoccus sp.]